MDRESSVVAIFDSYENVKGAAQELQRTGPSARLSLIGKHCKVGAIPLENLGRDKAQETENPGDGNGQGILMHEVFDVPGYGAIIVGGPLSLWVGSALRGILTEQGLSAVGSAFFHYARIPKERILNYEAYLKKDKFLLMARAIQEKAESIRRIFCDFKALEVDVHWSGVAD